MGKKNKKKKENNFNFLLKLLSIFLAVMAWFVVVQIENPDDSFTIKNVIIEAKNQDALDKDDLIFYGFNEDEITVKFSGGKVNLGRLREYKDEVRAVVDINDYYTNNNYKTEEGIYLPVTVMVPDKVKNAVKIDRQSLEYVLIKIDNKVTESLDIVCDIKANVSNSYYVDEENIKILPQKVEVSGAKMKIDSISEAKAYVEVNSPSGEITDSQVKLYDKAGKIIEGLTVSPEKIQVQVPVLTKKTVKLNLDVKNLNKNLELDSVKISPSEIIVAGSDEIISKLSDSLSISVDLENKEGTFEQVKEVVLNDLLKNVNDVDKVTIDYTLKKSEK